MVSGFITIAIDGGAATGKSSTAQGVAERLNLLHVDTGSHYRAVTLACLNQGLQPDDPIGVGEFIGLLTLGTEVEGKSAKVAVDGHVASVEELRSPPVNSNVSQFAALPMVRDRVKTYQRAHVELAREKGFNGLVMEGRDIGSIILPDADVKVFLEADPSTRTARRAEEGQKDLISERDRLDSARATAPLRRADGSHLIDTGALSLDEVINTVCDLANKAQETS